MENFYVGRQPILDREYKTTAYQLMFQTSEADDDGPSQTEKSAQLLVHGLMDIGLSELSNNLPVYIPATRELLVSGAVGEFPETILGVDLAADMAVDDEVLAVCNTLRQQGYHVMLSGVRNTADYDALLDVSDAVRIDIHDDSVAESLQPIRSRISQLVAAHVDSMEDYERAMRLGCSGFQGYFFCQPQIVEGRQLPRSSLGLMQALQEVITAEAIADVEGVITRDVSLSYRLLKHINSAAFGLRKSIESVRQALGLLGLANIRQWLSILLLADAGKDKPLELVRVAMLRGKVLEGIAETRHPERKADYFLLGLFSLLDAILGVSMADALAKLSLPEALHQGLTDPDSEYGRLLQLVRAMEQSDWQKVDELGRTFGLCCGDLMGIHTRAVHWAGEYSTLLSG
ncbi:MAG: HDOD domain-containing protein [Mariprofundaceae bacterium]|nr:HDOD domain-containing protein [Mariprofundaceae bacterium]